MTAETNGEFDYEGVRVWRVQSQSWLPLKGVNGVLRLLRRPSLSMTQQACSIAKGLHNALQQSASKARFDIVQAANWQSTGFFATRKPIAPVVVRASSYEPLWDAFEGLESDKCGVDKKLYFRLEVETMRRAAAVYAPSKFLSNEILKRTGIKTQVVTPPYYYQESLSEDTSISKKLADWPRYLLFFGRVCQLKGVGVLADAIEPLLQEFDGLNLAIAGPDSTEDDATQKLRRVEAAFPKQIRYLGALRPAQLQSVIRRAHAVVLPSLMDNLPNTCIEAMGLGQLVIGPDGVSFDELINDGESGILFQLGDSVSLRQAILRAWNMPDAERRSIIEAAKIRISQMAPERVLDDLERLYKSVISRS